jgi:hypothetical protein
MYKMNIHHDCATTTESQDQTRKKQKKNQLHTPAWPNNAAC